MLFLLTDHELLSAIQAANRKEDGRLAIDIPASRLQENAVRAPPLTFDATARTAHSGKASCRLSPTQFALLHYVYTHGKVGFHDLACEVWGGEGTSDNAIRVACRKINKLLCEQGFSVVLTVVRSRVSLELLA